MNTIVNAKIFGTHLDGNHAQVNFEMCKGKICIAFATCNVGILLSILKLNSWEELPGTYCRIELLHGAAPVIKIGHLILEKWFITKDV